MTAAAGKTHDAAISCAWGRKSALLLLVALVSSGCGEPSLETEYGVRGGLSSSSVNGTAVLAQMFADAGHRVRTRRALSPSLSKDTETIVWFPDDFSPPSEPVRTWLDAWLGEDSERTLIYVGRDFDAAPLYWKKISSDVSPAKRSIHKNRLILAESRYRTQHSNAPEKADAEWFKVEKLTAPLPVRTLSGPWAAAIDGKKTEIALAGRLTPPDQSKTLLASPHGVLAFESASELAEDHRIVVANGSFLLNLALVNHEHRKLAARLIERVGPPGHVVFLESDAGGPPILDKEPDADVPSSIQFLQVWPVSGILLHLALLGIIFCFARYPIFGVAVEPPPPPLSDFGQHVTALGKLLAHTGDRAGAQGKLAHYQELKCD